jgi:hypothetical protein
VTLETFDIIKGNFLREFDAGGESDPTIFACGSN